MSALIPALICLQATASVVPITELALPADWKTLPSAVEVWRVGFGNVYHQTSNLVVTYDYRTRTLHAYDKKTGEERWTAPIFYSEGQQTYKKFALGSDRHFYSIIGKGLQHHRLLVFDYRTGEVVWQQEGQRGFAVGAAEGLVVVFRAEPPAFVVLDAAHGTAIGELESDRLFLGIANGRVLFQTRTYGRDHNRIVALDPRSGKLVWTASIVGPISDRQMPRLSERGLLVEGQHQALLLDPETGARKARWDRGIGLNGANTLLQDSDVLLVCQPSGCVGVEADGEVLWALDDWGTVVHRGPSLFVMTLGSGVDAELRAISPKTGRTVWRLRAPVLTHRRFLPADGTSTLLVSWYGGQSQPALLVAIDVNDGKLQWAKTLPGGGEPWRHGDVVGFHDRRGLFAISLSKESAPLRTQQTLSDELDVRLSIVLDPAEPPTSNYDWFETHAPRETRVRLLRRLSTLPPGRAAHVAGLLDPKGRTQDRELLLRALDALSVKKPWQHADPRAVIVALRAMPGRLVPDETLQELTARVARELPVAMRVIRENWPSKARTDSETRAAVHALSVRRLAHYLWQFGPTREPIEKAMYRVGVQWRHPKERPAGVDTDGDGVRDAEERALGMNPKSADTDRDGKPDGADSAPMCRPRKSKRRLTDVIAMQRAALIWDYGFIEWHHGPAIIERGKGPCLEVPSLAGPIIEMNKEEVKRFEKAYTLRHQHLGVEVVPLEEALASPEGKRDFSDLRREEIASLLETSRVDGKAAFIVIVRRSVHGPKRFASGEVAFVLMAKIEGRWRVLGRVGGTIWIA